MISVSLQVQRAPIFKFFLQLQNFPLLMLLSKVEISQALCLLNVLVPMQLFFFMKVIKFWPFSFLVLRPGLPVRPRCGKWSGSALPSLVTTVVMCKFQARVSSHLALRDTQFRMRITLGVVFIRSLVSAVGISGRLRSGSGVGSGLEISGSEESRLDGIARLKNGFPSY